MILSSRSNSDPSWKSQGSAPRKRKAVALPVSLPLESVPLDVRTLPHPGAQGCPGACGTRLSSEPSTSP